MGYDTGRFVCFRHNTVFLISHEWTVIMLSFQPLTLALFSEIRPYFLSDAGHRRTCDYTVGTTFLWRHYFHSAWTVVHDTLLLRARYFDGGEMYTFPIGDNPTLALAALRDDCRARGVAARFCFTVSEDLPALEAAFGASDVSEEVDWADYLYDKAAFVSLAGRKYHGQRNFVNRFKKLYPEAALLPLCQGNLAAARSFIEEQYAKFPDTSPMATAEHEAILELLDNYDLYGMRGGVLTVGEHIAGLTVGDVIGDTLYVHVEKADTSYAGAYPMLAAAFAASVTDPAVLYINREEDMGDVGLRRAKQSWHPLRLIPKYTVVCR